MIESGHDARRRFGTISAFIRRSVRTRLLSTSRRENNRFIAVTTLCAFSPARGSLALAPLFRRRNNFANFFSFRLLNRRRISETFRFREASINRGHVAADITRISRIE